MRRLFIIRKDLHLSAGKLAAMCSHCAEAYWTNLIKKQFSLHYQFGLTDDRSEVQIPIVIDRNIWNEYVNGIFTKTVCEAKNMNQLRKVDEYIAAVNAELPDDKKLVQKVDYGYILDKCFTELTPENEDGTTTVGIWFRPLPDDIAHKISMKYKLYKD